MLDSGAFSAWKKGEQIDLRSYIEFVRGHRALLHAHVNLDVIPGRPGRSTESADVDAAAAQSFRNFEAMRAAGLDPIPVFHLGESEKWLRRILDSGAEWIGLGGSVGKPDEERYQFFARCFKLIGDRARVHGFGVTAVQTMLKFPWYSVDSTSWVMSSAMGAIFVPAAGRGGFDFSRLTVVRVSGEGSHARQAAAFGDGLGFYRAHLEEFLSSEGRNLARVRHNQYDRNYINIRCLTEAARAADARLFFSTWMKEAWHQAPQLTDAGARQRLLSYYEVRNHSAQLRVYVERGLLPTRAREVSMKEFDRQVYRGRRIAALVAREGADAEDSA